jgi:hypothetical protein
MAWLSLLLAGLLEIIWALGLQFAWQHLPSRFSASTAKTAAHDVTASFISRLSRAVDLIERRVQQNRPLKVVKVRRGFEEDADAAKERHFAAHPEDRGANIVLFKFFDMAGGEPGSLPADGANGRKDRGP